jgi:hypothetical protein
MNSIGPTVLYVGDAEQSRTLKLAINAGLAVTAQILAEPIVFGENNGIGYGEIDFASLLPSLQLTPTSNPHLLESRVDRQSLLRRRSVV